MFAALQKAEDRLGKWAHCGAQASKGSLLALFFPNDVSFSLDSALCGHLLSSRRGRGTSLSVCTDVHPRARYGLQSAQDFQTIPWAALLALQLDSVSASL